MARRFSSQTAWERAPQCGHRSDWVYYLGRVADGQARIFRIPATGGQPVQLSEGVTFGQPLVSPDEEHVAFAHPRKDGKVVGWVVSGATGKVESEFEKPTFGPVSRSMSWMPDSQFFVMADVRTGTSNLWALPAGRRSGETAHALHERNDLGFRILTRWEMDHDGTRSAPE
jgi:Tol biopolymer transport system component